MSNSWLEIRSLVFACKLLVFVSKIAIHSFPRANCSRPSFVKRDQSKSLAVALYKRATGVNCSRWSLKKSDGAKSNGSDSLLGIKKIKKTVKNCQKNGENNTYFRANNSFFESERGKLWFSLKKRENHSRHSMLKSDLLSSLFCKERQVRFTHNCSFFKSNESESLTVAL